MIFSTITFIYFFLPALLAAVYIAPGKWRNPILLFSSLIFFAWGAPRFVFALIAASLFDYILSIAIAKANDPSTPHSDHRRITGTALCALGITANLLLLAYFKYTNFAIASFNSILAFFNCDVKFGILPIVLPLGISFFTFQKISYLVDVKRGTVAPAPNFARYLLYIFFFPQLVLGPIIRYHAFAPEFDKPKASAEDFLAGLWRFAIGLARKLLIAGPLAAVADAAFAQEAASLSSGAAWLGLIAYTMQLYFDFAGYSDMAVGLGQMLGFKIPENFKSPYISRNMAEFWRRWHITLGAFMKEYLYIPLGGNRASKPRAMLNNWIVFIVSGIWHGAAWNFLFWGAWHGFWIMIAKLRNNKLPETFSLRHIPSIFITFLLVMIGWIFFRAESFSYAGDYLKSLFGLSACELTAVNAVLSTLTTQRITALILAILISFIPAAIPSLITCDWRLSEKAPSYVIILRTILTLSLIVLATLPLLSSSFSPFIYFRF